MEFKDLVGKTLVSAVATDDTVHFVDSEGICYMLYHVQDCCESVYIESIVGELSDLIGTTILMAEEATNEGTKEEMGYNESCTWTFYKLATIKGYVDIRFFGTSNGYYAESVDFIVVTE